MNYKLTVYQKNMLIETYDAIKNMPNLKKNSLVVKGIIQQLDPSFDQENLLTKEYRNPLGIWKISVDRGGDDRDIDLGTYTGYIDEIALNLGHIDGYKLHIEKVGETTLPTISYQRNCDSVVCTFDIKCGTWSQYPFNITAIKEAFFDRPVHIEEHNYFQAFVISKHIII